RLPSSYPLNFVHPLRIFAFTLASSHILTHLSLTTMRTSTIFATLLTMIIAVYAAPLDPAAVIPRSTIHDLNSFRAASHADQQAFLLALDPKTWTLSDADLVRITKQPKVAKLLNGRVLTMQDMRNWLVYFDEKHGKTKQD
ncbi:hypothetical protein C8F04DRAFT_342915, partial [Mycena alexandri]